MQDRVDLNGFTFDVLKHQAPICGDCDEQDNSTGFRQYEIKSLRRIWYRVVCVNDVGLSDKDAAASYIGPTGHYERMNVWSHLFSAVVFFVYVIVRPSTPMGQSKSLSSNLAAVSYAAFVITFFSSSAYHVYSANKEMSAVFRIGDYAGIYLGIAAGTLSDICVATLNLAGVYWQAVADVWIGMAILVVFFVVRRSVLDVEETRKDYFANKCTLGFARSTNVDLEHSSLRAAAGVAMAFSWILAIPGVFSTLENDCAWVFSGSRFVGTGILVFGMALDNVILYPDAWYKDPEAPPPRCYCSHSRRRGVCGGWIMSSHAIWHFIALFSTLCTTFGTEYVVSVSQVLNSS
jgi:predicted membrane channel-forming protein YqfA (hemolysin III family)